MRKNCLRFSAFLGAMFAADGALAYDWASVDAALEASSFDQGALVVNYDGGPVEYAKGFGNWTSYGPEAVLGENLAEGTNPVDDPIIVYSLSKTFAAVAVIAAIEDPAVSGLDYDTSIKTLINDVSPAVHAGMRVSHLLSMTNGQNSPLLVYPTNILTCINNPLFAFETCGKNVSNTPQAYNTHTLNLFDRYAPGQAFSYGAVPWQYLGLAALRAVNASLSTDMSFTAMVRHYLSSAGDADCDFDDTSITPSGNEWVAGGFYTNPKDGAALAEILRTGKCGERQILPVAALEAMRANVGISALYEEYNPDNSVPPLDYGMGLWISDARNQTGAIVSPDVTNDDLYLGIGADGAVVFFSPASLWSAYLHVSKSLSYQDAVNLAISLAPLITETVQNPN